METCETRTHFWEVLDIFYSILYMLVTDHNTSSSCPHSKRSYIKTAKEKGSISDLVLGNTVLPCSLEEAAVL